nr:MFS transporter [uncultured Sphingomonas sp.]
MNQIAQPLAGEPAPTLTLRGSMPALLILAVSICAGFTTMASFGIMAESAKTELGLSDEALGAIQGVSAAVPLVLLSIPIGLLVDRANRVRLLLACSIVWTLGTFLTALAPEAWSLFAGRMLTGIGATGALTACLSLTADLCLPADRGKGLLIVTLGKSLGQAAAVSLLGWLLGYYGAAGVSALVGGLSPWRSSQLALALGSALLVLPLLLLREPERREVAQGHRIAFRPLLGQLWERRTFLFPLFVGQTSVVMADAAAGIWAAPIIERQFAIRPADFAGLLGTVILVSGLAGALLGGLAADWGSRSGRRGGLLLGAIAAAAIGVLAALFPLMPTADGAIVVLGILTLAGTVTGLVTSVALTVLLPNEIRGLSIGAFISIAGLIGFGIAPPLVAVVSKPLGGEAALGLAQALVGVVVGLLSVVGFWGAMRRAPVTATFRKALD